MVRSALQGVRVFWASCLAGPAPILPSFCRLPDLQDTVRDDARPAPTT